MNLPGCPITLSVYILLIVMSPDLFTGAATERGLPLTAFVKNF